MKIEWSGDADLVAEMQQMWLEPVGRSPVDWHARAWRETKAFDSPVLEQTDAGEYRPVTAGVWVSIRIGEATCTYGRNAGGWWCAEYTGLGTPVWLRSVVPAREVEHIALWTRREHRQARNEAKLVRPATV